MADQKRPPIVYLIAQPTVSRRKPPPNLAPLYEHGEVKVVLPDGDSPTFNPERCISTMEARLEDFNPETDFLVWAGGDTLSAVFIGFLLSEFDITCFTWLRYERRRLPNGERTDDGATYVPVRINLADPQLAMQLTDEGREDSYEDDDRE